MKKIRLLFIPFLVILSFYSVKAIPNISNITIQPGEPWLDEDVIVSFVCNDQNYSIKQVYANVVGPNSFSIFNDSFTELNNSYFSTIDHSNLPSGQYNVTLYCENVNDENKTDSTTFIVSELTSSIENISPNPAYIEDEIEINVNVKVNDISIEPPEIVNFTVYLDDQEKPLISPIGYDIDNDWWLLRIDAPSSNGTYDVKVIVEYDEILSSSSISIEIKIPIQFDLINISNSSIIPNDDITLIFRALNKSNPIDLKKEYLSIKIGSVASSIHDISQVGNYSYVKILTPNLSAGTYDLDINFNYTDFVKTISEKIDYMASVSGKILNSDNKPVNAELTFKNNNVDKTFITNSDGSYSGFISLGSYDLEINFSNSKLFLDDVTIDEFNDPIKFDNTVTGTNLKDIEVIEIFVYEINLTYSDVYLEMGYDDDKVWNEKNIVVYKCENWDFKGKKCSGDWNLINIEIDKEKNLVKLNTNTLSAFLIGYKKEMYLEFSTDKEEYSLKDVIKITGVVKDNDENTISDVEIGVSIRDTDITTSTKTDTNGKFSLEFQGPENEGTYTVEVTAEKSSLNPVSKSSTIELVGRESLSLKIPDDIQVKEGQSLSTEILIINTGETDLSDLTLSLTGIPEEYYTLSMTQIDQITAGEEKKVPITFIIPQNVSEESYTVKFIVTYDDTHQEEELILTILRRGENETLSNTISRGFQFPSISLPSAYVVLPFEGFDIFSISLFAIFSFSASVWLKKRKFNAKLERNQVKNLLLDIKREINREPRRRIEWVKKEITRND